MEQAILSINFASTLLMTGVIWVTQLTQYPSFQWFSRDEFVVRHDLYRNRIALVAAPAMILELLSAVVLVIYPPDYLGRTSAIIGLLLIVVIWGSMFFLQIPLHEKLSQGFDDESVKRLISSNWIRTIAWTVRSGLVFFWLNEALKQ